MVARLEVASHHVPPRRDATSTRALNLELFFVDDDVLPHATLVDHRFTFIPPPAPDPSLLGGVVLPDVFSPMVDVGVVNVQPFLAISPPTFDHFQGRTGSWNISGGYWVADPGRLSLGLHATVLPDPFPPLPLEDRK